MPLILDFTFADGTKEVERIPAEIWRRDNTNVSKVFLFDKEVTNISLDPLLETADVNLDNNNWPPKIQPTRFQLYKSELGGRRGGFGGSNPMRDSKKEEEKD